MEIFEWSTKNKILDIIAEGKGIIPYEKIADMNSMFLMLENNVFFKKRELYSSLKRRAVTNNDYESSFYLYKTLEMQNLGDRNDLCNAQDVVLLCETGENRFQFMHNQYGFNSRKCDSASTLSNCIERETYWVIIALPTSNEVADIFEQTITGGLAQLIQG